MNAVSVIQLIVVLVYTVIYVNIWPIRKLGTTKQYKGMMCLSAIMIAIMVVSKAPAGVCWYYAGVLVKDTLMMLVSRCYDTCD